VDRHSQQARVLEWLRAYATDSIDVRRRFGTWLRLHPTDANALIEIATHEQAGQPLTAARLAEHLRLSPAATTALLHRLERTGHVARTRDYSDRRVVTLHAGHEARHLADEFFGPVVTRLHAVMERYPAEQLQQVEDLLRELHHAMRELLSLPPPAPPRT
jgi:DNA-binding MarR family transcriptional regulator